MPCSCLRLPKWIPVAWSNWRIQCHAHTIDQHVGLMLTGLVDDFHCHCQWGITHQPLYITRAGHMFHSICCHALNTRDICFRFPLFSCIISTPVTVFISMQRRAFFKSFFLCNKKFPHLHLLPHLNHGQQVRYHLSLLCWMLLGFPKRQQ